MGSSGMLQVFGRTLRAACERIGSTQSGLSSSLNGAPFSAWAVASSIDCFSGKCASGKLGFHSDHLRASQLPDLQRSRDALWDSFCHSRSFAKQVAVKPPKQGYQTPAAFTNPRQMRFSLQSAGVIGEPYKGQIKILWKDYLGSKGWKQLWRVRVLGSVKSMYTLAKCRSILGWNMKGFKQEVVELHTDICRHLAMGNVKELRQLVTSKISSQMKMEINQRERGGWHQLDWSMVRQPTLREVQIVQARMIGDPKHEENAFAQITVVVPSKQRFSVYGKTGQLVAGKPGEEYDVQDIWVFERNMKKKDISARWRLAGRLADTTQEKQAE
ncbi:hypothetical protein BSKO_00530 [Bryopsis sp. KO-2023]|nr:hypothetical protein BSKO_00530 [Bryopsis sp. KO-2023]